MDFLEKNVTITGSINLSGVVVTVSPQPVSPGGVNPHCETCDGSNLTTLLHHCVTAQPYKACLESCKSCSGKVVYKSES